MTAGLDGEATAARRWASFPAPVSRHLRLVTLFSPTRPLILTNGVRLTEVQVGYETYGELDGDGANTVVVCHALTGDSHVARHDPDDRPGWWEAVVGPGKPVDTTVFHVVCANVLGGCAGTTGPWTPGPAGRRLGTDFPEITMADMVAVHRELLAHLGIRRLHAVIGGSLGGMQALEWLLRHPTEARSFLLIAATARLSADNLAYNAAGRAAIRADPRYADGQYPDHATPDHGLGIARMIGHLTYLSPELLESKFGRTVAEPQVGHRPAVARGPFAVERYLEHQAAKLVERFDANTYLYLTAAMDRFDAFAQPARFDRGSVPAVHLFSFAADRLFGLAHSQFIRAQLRALGVTATHYHDRHSPIGHDAFLLEVPGYPEALARQLTTGTYIRGRR